MKHLVFCLLLVFSSYSYAQDFNFGKVSKKELLEKEHPLDKNANAAILYKEERSDFGYSQEDGFFIETNVFYRIKLYNSGGFDWGTQSINLKRSENSKEKVIGLKAVTYNLVNGKIDKSKLDKDAIFTENQSDYRVVEKFTMPNLKEGSVIEFKYKFISEFLSNINTVRLQETIPVNNVSIKFSAPEYYNYKVIKNGTLPIAIEEEKSLDNFRLTNKTREGGGSLLTRQTQTSFETESIEYTKNTYLIQQENSPALENEKYVNNLYNYASALTFELEFSKFPREPITYYSTSWEDVSKRIYESASFGMQIDKSNYFKEDLNRLITAKDTPETKVTKIYDFIKKKMSWNGYQGIYSDNVRTSYKEKTGSAADINLILVAMLREAGFDANPVLTSTKANGIPRYPSRSEFNYVIASVFIEGEFFLMDATRKNAKIGLLDNSIINYKGRFIRENGESQWVSLYPNTSSQNNVILTQTLNEDLTVTGSSVTICTDQIAYNMGESVSANDLGDLKININDQYPDIEIENLKVEAKDITQPIKITYDYESISGAEDINGKIYLNPLLHLATKENIFLSDTRSYPIDFVFPQMQRYIINITIPEGYTVESKPEDMGIALPNGIGKYIYKVVTNGQLIQLSAQYNLDIPIISPEDYAELKAFYNLMIEKENEKIVLVKA